MNASHPIVDPKELLPVAWGFVLGLAIIAFFVLLATGMSLTLLVDYGNVPYQ